MSIKNNNLMEIDPKEQFWTVDEIGFQFVDEECTEGCDPGDCNNCGE